MIASFFCTLTAHHQRGAAVFSAEARDLGLPAGVWPARLLCHLPGASRTPHFVFAHAWCDSAEQVHCYTSVRPFDGLTLILHAPLSGIDLDAARKESV